MEADDFIQRTPGESLRNAQTTRFQGLELEGRHRLGRRSRLAWSYTYLDAVNRSPDAGVTTLQNQPEHKVALTGNHDGERGLTLRGELVFVADRFALSRTLPTRSLELGDYAVLGVRISQSLAAGRLRLTGRLSNLLDRNYVDSIGFPAPGRTLYAGLELRSKR